MRVEICMRTSCRGCKFARLCEEEQIQQQESESEQYILRLIERSKEMERVKADGKSRRNKRLTKASKI